MLDGRRRDGGRSAGLTSSPDFFRTMIGLCGGLSAPSLSSGEATADDAVDDDGDCAVAATSTLMEPSVEEREWLILRASRESGGGDVTPSLHEALGRLEEEEAACETRRGLSPGESTSSSAA